MNRVGEVGYGWTLYADSVGDQLAPILPRLVHRDGRRRTPIQVAESEDPGQAREIFREIKRQLDIADREWVNPGQDPCFRALDLAKISMQLALKRVGRWDECLLDTGVTTDA